MHYLLGNFLTGFAVHLWVLSVAGVWLCGQFLVAGLEVPPFRDLFFITPRSAERAAVERLVVEEILYLRGRTGDQIQTRVASRAR